MLLDVQGIDVRYGRNHAVKSVDLTMDEREIVTVLGANGAGKSSLLKAIQGSEKSTGTVLFDGVDISGWSAPRRVNAGLVLVPEGRQIFVSMTVHENMQMGAYCRKDDVQIWRPGVTCRLRFSRAVNSRCWRLAGRCSLNRV